MANTQPETRVIKTPDSEHPITIEPSELSVSVAVGEIEIANSERALVLREAGYAPVFYIPRADIAMDVLERSETTSYCPYKGDCHYYDIAANGTNIADAAWTYENPYEAVEAIRDHLAFYPDRVTIAAG